MHRHCNILRRVKAALVTVLSIPLMLLAPALANAQGPIPNLNPTPDQMCDSTQQIVNTIRAQHPNATPDQVADYYDQMMGAKLPVVYQAFQGQQHEQLLELIHDCRIN